MLTRDASDLEVLSKFSPSPHTRWVCLKEPTCLFSGETAMDFPFAMDENHGAPWCPWMVHAPSEAHNVHLFGRNSKKLGHTTTTLSNRTNGVGLPSAQFVQKGVAMLIDVCWNSNGDTQRTRIPWAMIDSYHTFSAAKPAFSPHPSTDRRRTCSSR